MGRTTSNRTSPTGEDLAARKCPEQALECDVFTVTSFSVSPSLLTPALQTIPSLYPTGRNPSPLAYHSWLIFLQHINWAEKLIHPLSPTQPASPTRWDRDSICIRLCLPSAVCTRVWGHLQVLFAGYGSFLSDMLWRLALMSLGLPQSAFSKASLQLGILAFQS